MSTDALWSSSWKWFVGGLGFRSYFLSYGKSFFSVSGDRTAESLLREHKKYSKYTYYMDSFNLRRFKLWSQLFPFSYWFFQFEAFFTKSRDYEIPLRDTYFHKFFYYEDLFQYQKFQEIVARRRGDLNEDNVLQDQKINIISWLLRRSRHWARDYFYAAPAINVFPEKHYRWLDLTRILFVLGELGWQVAFLSNRNKNKWFSGDETFWNYDAESGQHFLNEFFMTRGDPEEGVWADQIEPDSGRYNFLKRDDIDKNTQSPFFATLDLITMHFNINYFRRKYRKRKKVTPKPRFATKERFDQQHYVGGGTFFRYWSRYAVPIEKIYQKIKLSAVSSKNIQTLERRSTN